MSSEQMPSPIYQQRQAALAARPARWLVTGAAGFIGSHLVETLLQLDQEVIGLDNFATGHQANLEDVQAGVTPAQWGRFYLQVGDVADPAACVAAVQGVDYVLHQAALGSVPRSLADPVATHRANVDGFLNMLVAARDQGVKRFVYASSSSVYGDHPGLPKVEAQTGRPLSPYALTKSIDEQYAALFGQVYAMQNVGLRYFNVFGRRQDPGGPYAAVIPKWIAALLRDEACYLNGDGTTSRDFCYVANAVQANLLAATSSDAVAGQVFNVAVGARTTLAELFFAIRDGLAASDPALAWLAAKTPVYRDFRAGDVRHSLADITKAREFLGYAPTHTLGQGLDATLTWYRTHLVGAEQTAR